MTFVKAVFHAGSDDVLVFALHDNHWISFFSYRTKSRDPVVLKATSIMISKNQWPFSSPRAVGVFWHFLNDIEYCFGNPKPAQNMSTDSQSKTLK